MTFITLSPVFLQRSCLRQRINDFLVNFWKVTVLQVNWLVSQECSWELSNLLYLYPSKISNLTGLFFSIHLCSALCHELKMFPNTFVTWQENWECVKCNVFHFLVMKSNKPGSLFLGGPMPIIINQSAGPGKTSFKNTSLLNLIKQSSIVDFVFQ